MLQPIVIVVECSSGVVGRVDEDALDLARELLFKGFEREEIVAEDKPVIEKVVIGQPMFRVLRPLLVIHQDARLQPRPVLLADPGEFEFGLCVSVSHVRHGLR